MLKLAGICSTFPYFIFAMFLWIALEGSGIHATIAGIIGAFTVPTYSRHVLKDFNVNMRRHLDQFDLNDQPGVALLNNPTQSHIVRKMGQSYNIAVSPLQKVKGIWHIPSTYLVIPLFALANAAIPIDAKSLRSAAADPIALGIFAGLVLGKPIGIAGSLLLATKLGVGSLPAGVTTSHIIGASMLAGIGFTMSIFIFELAFAWNGERVIVAKMGIMTASLVAGIGGYLLCLRFTAAATNMPTHGKG